MTCPQCELAGNHPFIYDHGTESQCVGYFPFEGQDGILHIHDPNQHVTHYRCSMEHEFAVVWYAVCGCGWCKLRDHEVEEAKP